MDSPTFSCLETSPAIKYVLLKKRKCHTNNIFVDREKYRESVMIWFTGMVPKTTSFLDQTY